MALTVDKSLVPRHQHPLNKGKRSSQGMVGLANGRYSPYDRVSPIVDSMMMSRFKYHSGGAFAKRPRESDDGERVNRPLAFLEGEDDDGKSEKKAKTTTSTGANCPCALENPKLLVADNDGANWVCSNCGIVAAAITVSLHREKACSADEDRTQHAEVPQDRQDRFAQPATDLKTARQLKHGRDSACILPKNRNSFGFEKERIERLAMKAEENRGSLSSKAQTQEYQLLIRLEHLFGALEPMPDELKRFIRVETYAFFHAYVKHNEDCKMQCCRFTGLRNRSLQYLATTCLAATLEQLEDKTCTISIEPEQLNAVLERKREQDAPASLRTAVRELRLFLEKANNYSEMPACEAGAQTVAAEIASEDETRKNALEEAEKEGGAFGRHLRTFLRKLSFVEGADLVAFTIEFYKGKYEKIATIMEASTLSWPAKAFAAMEIAALAKEGAMIHERSARIRPALLASLGATEDKVVEFMEKLHAALE